MAYKDPEAQKAYQKKWYLRNKEAILVRAAAYRIVNTEHRRKTQKEYRLAHKERLKEQKKAWVAKNRERKKEIDKAWRDRHPQATHEANKKYYLLHREMRLAQGAAWRYRSLDETQKERYEKLSRKNTFFAFYQKPTKRSNATTAAFRKWRKLNPTRHSHSYPKNAARATYRRLRIEFGDDSLVMIYILTLELSKEIRKQTGAREIGRVLRMKNPTKLLTRDLTKGECNEETRQRADTRDENV